MEKQLNIQKKFQKLLKNDVTTQDFKNTMFLGLFEEVAELMKETPFKKHKKNQTFNKDNFCKELVDIQIYLLNLLISVGLEWKDFEQLVDKKQKINFDRQQTGY